MHRRNPRCASLTTNLTRSFSESRSVFQGCNDKEKKFIEKRGAKSKEDNEKELARLTKMAAGTMKAELKQWLMQRLNIMKQL